MSPERVKLHALLLENGETEQGLEGYRRLAEAYP